MKDAEDEYEMDCVFHYRTTCIGSNPEDAYPENSASCCGAAVLSSWLYWHIGILAYCMLVLWGVVAIPTSDGLRLHNVDVGAKPKAEIVERIKPARDGGELHCHALPIYITGTAATCRLATRQGSEQARRTLYPLLSRPDRGPVGTSKTLQQAFCIHLDLALASHSMAIAKSA